MPPMPHRASLAGAILALASLGLPAAAPGGILDELDYELGRGLRIGSTGFHVGGYVTLELEHEEDEPASIELDGPSFLVQYDGLPWLRAFAEVELEGLAETETDRWRVRSDAEVELERAHVELLSGDEIRLRLGKLRTPVGRWSQVRAEPFVWTASEPLIVERPIDETLSGAMLSLTSLSSDHRTTYALFGHVIDPILAEELDEDDLAPLDRFGGARVELASGLETWSVAATGIAGTRDGHWHALGGLDGVWSIPPLELSAEVVLARGRLEDRELWGFYLQAVGEVLPGLHLVGRWEHFDPSTDELAVEIGTFGLVWSPIPQLRLKTDYRITDRTTEDVAPGAGMSLSLIF